MSEEKPSISAFIEQTAKLLRSAAKTSQEKIRSYAKKTLGASNTIEQIASMLRSAAKRTKKKK